MTENATKISGFVMTYNSGDILETCLRSLRFVDELIVVDKSSTDQTPIIAARYADKLITVPWSPLPTETRLVAHDACTHDFILYLDHDECLNVEGIRWVKQNAASHPGQAFRFPKREIAHWLSQSKSRSDYVVAAALLRAVYDIVDHHL